MTSILIFEVETSFESCVATASITLPPIPSQAGWDIDLFNIFPLTSPGNNGLEGGSLGVFGVSGIGGGTLVGDLLVGLPRPFPSSKCSRSRVGSFNMESFFVIVPEE